MQHVIAECDSGDVVVEDLTPDEAADFDEGRASTEYIRYGESERIIPIQVRTVDVTPAELFRKTLAPMTGYLLRLSLLAMADNNQLRSVEGVMVVGRANQDALIVNNADGQNQTIQADHRQGAGASSWNIQPGVSGTDFYVTVTGAAGRTIDWRFTGSFETFSPAGIVEE